MLARAHRAVGLLSSRSLPLLRSPLFSLSFFAKSQQTTEPDLHSKLDDKDEWESLLMGSRLWDCLLAGERLNNQKQFRHVSLERKGNLLFRLLDSEADRNTDISESLRALTQLITQQLQSMQPSDQIQFGCYLLLSQKYKIYRDINSPQGKLASRVQIIEELVPVLRTYLTDYKADSNRQIDCREATHLLLFILRLPPDQQALTFDAIAPFIPQIGFPSILVFLQEASQSELSITKPFFDSLYRDQRIETLEWPFNLYLLEMAIRHRITYSPLINFFSINISLKQMNVARVLTSTKSIQALLRALKHERTLLTEVYFKGYVNQIYYIVTTIENLFSSGQFSGLDIMRAHDLLNQIHPMGSRLLRTIASSKSSRPTDPKSIQVYRKFVRNMVANIEPYFIHSPDQPCVRQISNNILLITQAYAKITITADPFFLLEISPFCSMFYNRVRNNLQPIIIASLTKINQFLTSLPLPEVLLPQNLATAKKLLDFLTYGTITLTDYASYCQSSIQIIRNLVMAGKINNFTPKTLYQLIAVTQPSKLSRYEPLIREVCLTYMHQRLATPLPTVNVAVPEDQYILLMISLTFKAITLNHEEIRLLTQFINTRFIFQIKAVVGMNILNLLKLAQTLPAVDIQVLELLYGNLSTFVMYSANHRKYYLPRGDQNQIRSIFVNIMKNAIRDYKRLRQVKDKNRLKILRVIAFKFWKDFADIEIAKFLIIQEDPASLPKLLQQKIRAAQFSQQIMEINEIDELAPFCFLNDSLKRLVGRRLPDINKVSDHLESFDVKKLSQRTAKELLQIFKDPRLYTKILETAKIKGEECLLPAPASKDPKTNSAYICLRAFAKIYKHFDFEIGRLRADTSSKVNLQEEIKMMKEMGLIKQDDVNEFKLGNFEVDTNQTLIWGWQMFQIYEQSIQIQDFSNVMYSQGNPYEKALLSLMGNTSYVMQHTRKQYFFDDILFAAKHLELDCVPQGCLFKISHPSNPNSSIYLFSTTQSSFKIHTIFAYVFQCSGIESYIVTEQHSSEEIQEFLKNRFRKIIQRFEKQSAKLHPISDEPDISSPSSTFKQSLWLNEEQEARIAPRTSK